MAASDSNRLSDSFPFLALSAPACLDPLWNLFNLGVPGVTPLASAGGQLPFGFDAPEEEPDELA